MPISSIVVELEFTRAEQAEDPYAFRFAAQDYLQRTSGGGFERSHLMWDAALLADLAALRQRKPSPVVLQRIGEALRRFLMPLGWGELAAQIAEAVRQGRRVLLTIRSAAAELYALPWELVTLKQSGQPETGRRLIELTGHKAGVNSANYSPDGRRILTASWDKTARVWDAATGRLLVELSGHSASVNSAAYSPDGRRILTAGEDQTTRIWDAETGRIIGEPRCHQSGVWSATLSPDGRHMVIASDDDRARVLEVETGHLIAELVGHQEGVNSANYSPDGRRIVTSSADKTARLWDAETGRLLAVLRGHGASVWSAMFSPDSRFIVTASVDKTARVWDVSPETRTAEQVAQQIRRRLLVRFESEGSSVIVPAVPELADG